MWGEVDRFDVCEAYYREYNNNHSPPCATHSDDVDLQRIPKTPWGRLGYAAKQ